MFLSAILKAELMNMDIRILRYFLAVAREENITRAAESLHISQPSLSKQLMELEREIGKPLLLRGKRKLTLTEDGVLLRKRAEEIVALMDKTEHELSTGASALSGEIAIGGGPTAQVLEAAAALHAAHPEVRFDFYSSDATDVLERLDHGSLDFAVVLQPVDTLKYDFLPLRDTSCWGVLMPSGCPLTMQSAVTPEQLRRLPLIMHRRPGLQREIARWAHCTPEKLHTAATYNVVNGDPAAFVQSGLGYFLTSDAYIPSPLNDSVCFRPLEPSLTLRYALIWKRYAVFSKVAEAFLRKLKALTAQ